MQERGPAAVREREGERVSEGESEEIGIANIPATRICPFSLEAIVARIAGRSLSNRTSNTSMYSWSPRLKAPSRYQAPPK